MMRFVVGWLFVGMVIVFQGAALVRANEAAATQPAGQASDKIKVGLIFDDPVRNPITYKKWVPAMLKNFTDDRVELFALTTQQMAQEKDLAEVLEKNFDEQHRLDGTDAANLRGLNVIVAYFLNDVPEEMLGPVTEAVEGGVGLIIQGSVGGRQPGYGEKTEKLSGIKGEQFCCDQKPTEAKIVADHPLVAELKKAYPDGKLQLDYIMGAKGEVQGTPLIVSVERGAEAGTDEVMAEEAKGGRAFCPLYVAELGKGKIVGCQWYSAGRKFRDATEGKFHIKCAEWLAGKN